MADIAQTALRRGRPSSAGPAEAQVLGGTDGPAVADVWTSGDLGFALLVHRRHDGLLGEELYYSVRRENGDWESPDHLSGGILGTDVSDPSAVESALTGAPMAVAAESESLVLTGRGPSGDEGELVRVWELLVSGEADLVEIELVPPRPGQTPQTFRREVTGPLILLVLRPGERVRVSAMRGRDASLARLGEALGFHNPESDGP
jgi:hypothetical protein